MRTQSVFPTGLLLLVLMASPIVATAQTLASLPNELSPASRLTRIDNAVALSMAAQGEKSPLLAGVLSWIIPGVGSFYAENSGHGIRHLAIQGVGVGLLIWGAVETDDINDIHAAVGVGLVVVVVNGIWSIVVAVTDANAYNRSLGGSSSIFQPQLKVYTARQIGPPGVPQTTVDAIDLQILRIGL